jgi:hypothetical protein
VKVKLLLDHAGMARLIFCKLTTEPGDPGDRQLHFTASAPARAIVVFHNRLNPAGLTGAVLDAKIAREVGFIGYVRAGNVGLEHSKISIYRRMDGPPDQMLSQVLTDGLQDEALGLGHGS